MNSSVETFPPYYEWSPLPARKRLSWPGGARVAFGVLLTLEHYEWYPPAGTVIPPSTEYSRFRAYPSVPDIHALSYVEYGNRVGIFRLLDVLDNYEVIPTIAIDVYVAERTPYLVEKLVERGVEFVGRGIASSRLISEQMSVEEERSTIHMVTKRLEELTGKPLRGWHGPDYSESSRTVALLAQYGLDYVLDWPNDEQPVEMKVPGGRMTNIPMMVDLDDRLSMRNNAMTPTQLSEMMIDAFSQLYEDGADTGRLYFINVHPWLSGQPYRIPHFERALAHVMSHERVWPATGGEIVDWYRAQL